MKNLLFIVLAFIVVFIECTKQLAGTNDETISANLYMPDGKQAAVEADIAVYSVGDTSRTPKYLTSTDYNGNYSIAQLPDGLYNIFASKDSLVAYQDSIRIVNGHGFPKDDSLETQGLLTGYISIQPNDDPRNVIVNIAGTDIWSNVNANGQFTLNRIATGEYSLALVPSQPQMQGYVITFYSIDASGGIKDTINSPFLVTYTGIPVVTGLSGSYDSINGIVNLKWNKPDYLKIKEYVIYRAEIITGTNPQYKSCGVTNDTSYSDKIFMDSTVATKTFEYYVCIKNNSLVEGSMYEFLKINAINPTLNNVLFESDTITAYLNVPCTLSVRTPLVYGKDVEYLWDIGNTGSFSKGDSDTIITVSKLSPVLINATCQIKGINQRRCSDSIFIQTGIKWERIADSFDSLDHNSRLVRNNNTLILINKRNLWTSTDAISWKLITDSIPFALFHLTSFKENLIVLDSSYNLWKSQDGSKWENILTPFVEGYSRGITTFGEKLYVSRYNAGDSPEQQVWESSDLVNWNQYGYLTDLILRGKDFWYGNAGDSILWYASLSMTGRVNICCTSDISLYNGYDNKGDYTMYASREGIVYGGLYILFGNGSLVSKDGLNGWNPLPETFTGKSNLVSAGKVICLNGKLFLINSSGIYLCK
jgi:hypothetical protein